MAESHWQAHAEACRRGEHFYEDPETGLRVFTEVGLRARGRCCGSGCRHCPYGHGAVALDRRHAAAQQPAWLTRCRPPQAPADLLFWSGGKDSFLAYRALKTSAVQAPVILITTFDAATRQVAHQEVPIRAIVRQAEYLALPLIGVPLHPGLDYVARVAAGLALAPAIKRLVFGDLHLGHVRDWRERAFAPLVARYRTSLHFPLWRASYDGLIADLEASGVSCEISAVEPAAAGVIRPGQRFDRALMARLPEGVDRFGENGEFHTLIKPWVRAPGASLGASCSAGDPR